MIGIVSQARMTSSRLPGKILKNVKQKSLLQLHVDRLRWSGFPVFIATTANATDDVVEQFCKQNDVGCFRGDEQDVLSRYNGLAKKFNLSTVVRVTSDCPLIDGDIVKAGVERFLKLSDSEKPNYLTNCQKRTFPRGFDFEVFSAETLFKMQEVARAEYEREHVTPYIWKSHPENYNIVHFTRQEDDSRFRITVDEPDDFKLIEKLIIEHDCDRLKSEEIIEILKTHPQLAQINAHVEQKKV